VKTPFVVPEKHPLSEFSPSIERTNFSVAAHHNPPVKRKRSKSRKLARGRSLCSQPSHDNKGMRSQTVGTVWC
jgi:hypothetical protein